MKPALLAGRTVAVLGANSSAASALARALAVRLQEHDVRVVDDGLLGAAIASELLHGDRSPTTRAQDAQRGHAFTLLVGLELPAPDDPRAETAQRHERIDALLRTTLIGAGLPFAVIHGQGSERLANALRALGLAAPDAARRMASRDCDKCSDPACEHRLFTDLLRGRAESGTAA